MGVAKDERLALCSLFDELGPEAPTLCTGWRTRDLAAHLVLREHRPDAAPGILLSPLAGHTQRVQDNYAARPWSELVGSVRSGPPRFWPTAFGPLDEIVNGPEFLVHHEDVRRAQPDWAPRDPDPRRDATALASIRRIGRLAFRRSPVGVVLLTPAGAEVTAKRGPNPVTITGEPVELLFYAFGRDAVHVSFEGDKSALDGVSRGL
ncbi:TIGR03085 family metal-binding protein [Amycolatopsis nigrescens]|uniref:TIGR03085 family metal-binding protein n=1 Tax=Amycolatopsis nigrescens TaxID=381445 RepID=UPI0003634738|nr:TIGR03085 family metal-binding protein [Amycolatopsis nigrescens]